MSSGRVLRSQRGRGNNSSMPGPLKLEKKRADQDAVVVESLTVNKNKGHEQWACSKITEWAWH